MAKLYVVSLSDADRLVLQQTIKDKHTAPRRALQARILLKAETANRADALDASSPLPRPSPARA